MRIRFSLVFSIVALLFIMSGIFSQPAYAESAPSQLSADIIAKDSTKPNLHLKNISSEPCQVATTARGTVAITKVSQADKVLQPQILDIGSDEDIGDTLKSQLKTLKPGDSVDIPLEVYKLQSGYILRSTTWSSDGGAFGSQYQIKADQSLQLELNYSLSSVVTKGGAPSCGAVFASTIATNAWLMIVLIAGIVIVAIILIVLLLSWWLRRRNHRKTPAVVAGVLLAMALTGLYQSKSRYYGSGARCYQRPVQPY